MSRDLLFFGQDYQNRVEKALAALKQGNGIIIVDDGERENEGDLIFSACSLTEQHVSMLIRHCSGIVCLCLTQDKATSLNLPLMVKNNSSHFGTAFTISIEAARGVTTGVSAKDRLTTIKAAVAPKAKPEDLNSPGHVFPLIAKADGVLEREGHTEATIDMMKLAGLPPAGVLCELTNDNGTMSKMPEITDFAIKHKFPVLSVEDIILYRKNI